MNGYNQSPFANITPVVKNLLIINVLFFIGKYALEKDRNKRDNNAVSILFQFARVSSLANSNLYVYARKYRTHIFHMFALFMFGPTLEYTLGSKRFLQYYFITGIGALALQMLVQGIEVHSAIGAFTVPNGDISPYVNYVGFKKVAEIYYGATLGASGSVFGLLLAFGFLFPNVELMMIFIPVPIKAKYFVGGYILLELFSGIGQFAGDSVAHFAHIGGALFGYLILKIWRIERPNNFY